MSEFGGGGILGGLGGIVAGIANAIGSFFGITAKDLLKFLNWVKEHVIDLATKTFQGLWKLARGVGRLVRTLATLVRDGVRAFVTRVWTQLQRLQQFLKDKFGPVLQFIRRIKDEINAFYNKYIRPIIDTIEFIRRLNSLLQVFHIDLLKKLDSVLQKVEQRIEEPFLWVQQKISWLENWIDRIVTVDGLFKKAALLSSMVKYSPSWVSGFWNSQINSADVARRTGSIPTSIIADPPEAPGEELGKLYRGEPSRMDDDIDELVQLWRDASGLTG